MGAGITRALSCVWLLVGLCAALSAGCDDNDDGVDGNGDENPGELTDFERGNIGETRWDACGASGWEALSVEDSLGIVLTTYPGAYKSGVECLLAAKDCRGVVDCDRYFRLNDQLHLRPECDTPDYSGHCDGNVITYCTTDNDVTWHEVTYDCALAGATCSEFSQDGRAVADCFLPGDPCNGKAESYCDGRTAVVCRENPDEGILRAARFNCADAFDGDCVEGNNHSVSCAGPKITEWPCNDTVDNDDDGVRDCDDPDCSAECD